jgi:hypothetical protein
MSSDTSLRAALEGLVKLWCGWDFGVEGSAVADRCAGELADALAAHPPATPPQSDERELREALGHLIWAVEVEIQGGNRTRAFINQHRSKIRHWISEVKSLLATPAPAPAAEPAAPRSENDYVAWMRYTGNSIVACDSDSKGAFKVYRWAATVQSTPGEEIEYAKGFDAGYDRAVLDASRAPIPPTPAKDELRDALEAIAAQDSRFMDNRRITEWDVRCYVCKAYSTNELVDGSYQMVFKHNTDCPIEISLRALAAQRDAAPEGKG